MQRKSPAEAGLFRTVWLKRYFWVVVLVLVVVSLLVSVELDDGVLEDDLLMSTVVELLDGAEVSAGFVSIVVLDELAGGVGFVAMVVEEVLDGGVVLAFFSTDVVEEVCVRSHAEMPKAATTASASAGMTRFIGPLQCTQGLCRPSCDNASQANFSVNFVGRIRRHACAFCTTRMDVRTKTAPRRGRLWARWRLDRPRYWQASHSGLSIEQNLPADSAAPSPAPAASAPDAAMPPVAGTALSSPPLPVDFSAEVAARVRR